MLRSVTGGSIRRLFLLAGVLALLGAGCVRRQQSSGPPPGGIYRSDDQGSSFVQKVALSDGGHLARVRAREVAAVPAEPETLTLAAVDGLFRTATGGERWERVRVPLREVLSLAADPANPQALFVAGVSAAPAGRGVILKSLSGGETWTEVFVGPTSEEVRGTVFRRRQTVPTLITALAIDPLRPEVVFAGTSNGTLLVSADGGVSWKTEASFRQGLSSLKISPAVSGRLFIRLASGELLHSEDSGVTSAPAPASRRAATLRPEEKSRTALGLLQKSDPVHALLFLRPDASGREAVLAGTETGLYRSDDGGATWTVLPVPSTGGRADVSVQSLAQSADGTLWAASGFVLFSSRDGGTSWRASATPLQKSIRFIVADPVNRERLTLIFAS